MITLLPLKDDNRVKALFEENSLDYDFSSGCITAECGGEELGRCLYSLDDERIVIFKIYPEDDLPLADGILRSALNAAAVRGALNAFYCGDGIRELCRKLNFIKNESENRLDAEKLFGGCRGCGG